VVEIIYPAKLRRGDEIRVIAPSMSQTMVTEYDHTAIIERRFADLGLAISYGAHVDERDAFDSSAVGSRVADLHAAFADPAIAAVMTVIGGYNSNELLPSLDWGLIRANPKVFCGYSARSNHRYPAGTTPTRPGPPAAPPSQT
jgi:muramoyltetrapeptide carboxypeptidase